ncbi:MAG: tRNA pseudouridine synthase A [Methanomassiliicoccales archaeon]|jgi:tRNA pseudouridine38-40 synthase
MWHAALKFAYSGKEFNGSQRQPGVRTAEGEIIKGLMKIEAIDSPTSSRFRVASRTDRGVSALCNVVCFDTDFSRDRLLHALNAVCDGVYFHSIAEVPEVFSPRRAKERWYRYHLDADGIDVLRFTECADLFIGKHDFKRFCKPEGKSTLKTVNEIKVTQAGGLIVIDLYAREFLRNMVRRTVAAMEKVGRGDATVDQVRRALEGEDASFGLADPEGLFLMEIRYDVEFVRDSTEPLLRRSRERRRGALLDLFFYDSLSPDLDDGA